MQSLLNLHAVLEQICEAEKVSVSTLLASGRSLSQLGLAPAIAGTAASISI